MGGGNIVYLRQLKGPVEECCCDVDTVDRLNQLQIYPLTNYLTGMTYFRFFKVRDNMIVDVMAFKFCISKVQSLIAYLTIVVEIYCKYLLTNRLICIRNVHFGQMTASAC